jgi:hypothetical protein
MTTPSQSLLDHLSDNWSHTAISYQNFNGVFDPQVTRTGFTNNDIYIVPRIEMVTAEWQNEIPQEQDTVIEFYNFEILIVAYAGTGLQNVEARVANLKALYDRTTVTNEGNTMRFREFQALQGEQVGFSNLNPDAVLFTTPTLTTFQVARVDS